MPRTSLIENTCRKSVGMSNSDASRSGWSSRRWNVKAPRTVNAMGNSNCTGKPGGSFCQCMRND